MYRLVSIMSTAKFPNTIDYDALKRQFGEEDSKNAFKAPQSAHLIFDHSPKQSKQPRSTQDSETITNDGENDEENNNTAKQRPGLTGTRLRSYAFAVLTRKEYSKQDLIEKLALYAEDREEVIHLVDELARENYQSDQRVAEMLVRSQLRKGKGPNRIKLALNAKKIDKTLANDDMQEVDWYQQAYTLKVKKYGVMVATDPKIKAKQIRFLQYRGFEMDTIMKAIRRKENEDD